MLLPLALLLLHPQLAPKITISGEEFALQVPSAISASIEAGDDEISLPAVEVTTSTEALPVAETAAPLPAAPAPLETVAASTPAAFLRSAKSMKVSVRELAAENRRKQLMWKGLAVAASGAATFDAWSTRRAITTTGAQELNPLLRPFAGNSSLYAAIQVAPALMDFAGKKMMYSRYSWVRHIWWVPQSASFVSSMFCGAHNVAFH